MGSERLESFETGEEGGRKGIGGGRNSGGIRAQKQRGRERKQRQRNENGKGMDGE